jgi:hypothetical protein
MGGDLMKALRKLGFDIGYLALLTKREVKPLSRWENGFSRRQVKALHHLGLKTDTAERKLANGRTFTELIFSTSSHYLDFYTRKFHQTPLRKNPQTVLTEGLLFGYPACCARNFAENGYTENTFVGYGQEILFHWACPNCRVTPSLLPYYRKTHRECRQLQAAQSPSGPELLKKSLPVTALSLLFALAPMKARGDELHWLPLGPEDPDGNYLTYSEEVLLGTHLGSPCGELPNGPEEALRFSSIINSLPETPSVNFCYKQLHYTYGVENCHICGETLNMGYVSVHNPMRGISVNIPFMGLHYMEHGSFSYDGSTNSGRVDIELLKEVLVPFDTAHFAIETANDLDDDGLRDEYEDDFGTHINNSDSNGNQLVDGAELAEGFIEKMAKLPVVGWGEKLYRKTPYVEYQEMDGLENCDICGMAINMGDVRIVNPMKRTEMTFPIVGLHYLAHGRFSYGANSISGEVDARQLNNIMSDLLKISRRESVPEKTTVHLFNRPNPFNAYTEIEFSLPEAGHTALRIYNINGQLMRTLKNDYLPAGSHTVRWDGLDQTGGRVASGIYFCRLDYRGSVQARKMLLLK